MLSPQKPLSLFCFSVVLALSATSSLTALATNVPLQTATATIAQSGFEASKTIDGNATSSAWAIINGVASNQKIVWEATSDVVGAGGSNLTFNIIQTYTGAPFHTFQHFRLSVTGDNRSTFADGVEPSSSFVDGTATWFQLTPLTVTDTGGATLTVNGDNSISATGTNPLYDTYTITATSSLTTITGFRLEAFADGGVNNNVIGRSPNGNIALTEFNVNAEAIATPEPSGLILAICAMCAMLRVRKK